MSRQAHTTTTQHRIKTILTVVVVAMVVSAGALAVVAVGPVNAAPDDETPSPPEDGPVLGENGTLVGLDDDSRTDDDDSEFSTGLLDGLDPSATGPAPPPAERPRASAASVSAADASPAAVGEPVTACRVIDSPGLYTLTENIRNSGERVCIDIQSEDVVFDGNGFTIDGVDSEPSFGVLANGSAASLSNITVTNLRATDWNFGITYANTNDGRIADNTAISNAIGIYLEGANNNELLNTTTNANLIGIGLVAASSNDLTSNTANENLNGSNIRTEVAGSGIVLVDDSNDNTLAENTANDNSNVGIYLSDSSGNTLTDNDANRNDDTNAESDFPGIGILLDSGSQDNTLSANTARSNDLAGVVVNGSDRNSLTDNVANDNPNGIAVLESSGSDLTDNTANDNVVGIQLSDATNNDLTNNTVRRSVTGTFQNVPAAGDGIVLNGATDNDLTDNVVTDSEGDGISLSFDSADNLIYDNFLDNENNVDLTENDPANNSNDWNVNPRPEANVIGGDTTGGNYYVEPVGPGYSEECANTEEPLAFCDEPNDLDDDSSTTNNVDEYPLAALAADTDAPTVTGFDVSASGQNVDVAFDSDEQLADIAVNLGGDESGTLTEGDFTESQSGGTFTYTADISDGQDGTFSATLTTAADGAGNDGADGQSDSVTVSTPPDNQGPSAAFAAPSSATVGEQVSFDASGSSDSDGSIGSYEWDFGDGNSASSEQVTHTYGSAGEYDVTLTVTDDDGATDTATKTITVNEEPSPPANDDPSASFTTDPSSPETGESVSFDAAGSSDSDGSVQSYAWSFGDGDTATGEQATHTYGSAGDYTVELTVTDDDGATDTATRTISVTEDGPDGNVLQIEGTGPAAQYDFSVTDDLAKSTANGANINGNDEVQRGYVGDGEVGTASDSYTFTGSLETIRIPGGGANVYLNGQQLSTEELANMPNNVVEVEGTGPAASYDFAAVGTSGIQKVTANSSNLNGNDEVWRTTAYGRVGTARDAFGTDGALDSLDVDGDANVYINGEAKDPATEEDHVITIVGTGPAASYDFAVGSGLSKSTANFANINRNDNVAGNTAMGEVGTASDSFVYNGDISAFTVAGDATVYVDGERIDQKRVADEA